jgi:hypothetical protein
MVDDGRKPGSSPSPHVMCREIAEADFPAVLAALQRGFPEAREYYVRALQRLTSHVAPPGFPKYGYVLQVDGAIVGVVLTICSSMPVGGEERLRMNPANWYVDPEYRGYAAMMTSRLRTYKQATYLNITPAPHTWTMLEALGYRRFCNGAFFAVAALSRNAATAAVRRVTSAVEPGGGLSAAEAGLLSEHARFGCISVVCEWKKRRYPFVFLKNRTRWKGMRMPYAQLIYCRDFESYVQLAGPLGRFLLRRGLPLVLSDANEPVPGLTGRYYVDWGVKFFRGPHRPHLGDLSYTEWAMFSADSTDTAANMPSVPPAIAGRT